MVTKGKEDSKDPLFVDDLLIIEMGVEVYKLENETLFYNNHDICLPD